MKLFWPEVGELKTVVKQFQEKEPLYLFHPQILSFIQDLSKHFIRLRDYPELVALGFWLRKANVQDMKDEWKKRNADHFFKARGTVFHIAPSNVDTIFVYSWILSLLSGNRNIIRLSSKEHIQSNILLSVILNVLKDPVHINVAERTILVTYGHDEQLTAFFSSHCHIRVVWGGDNTIEAIRRIPLPTMANELVFPDRFSLAIINANTVLELNREEKNRFLQHFYNDSFWFDQMACSSPRLIVWIGTENIIKSAQEDFWESFELVVRKKEYELMAATQMMKFTTGLWLAADQSTISVSRGISYSRISFDQFPVEARERHCGGGLFFECSASSLIDVSSLIIDKDQTLAYFGYGKADLFDFAAQISTRGIDRIVPVGQALSFNGVWDGQSFLKSFTREVVIL